MIKETNATKYAQAFFNAASADEKLEELLKLLALMDQLLKNSKIQAFFNAPQIKLADKEAILHEFIPKTFFNYFIFLLREKKFTILPEIFQKYLELMNERGKILQVRFLTALPIDTLVLNQLLLKLKSFYQKKVEIKNEIDPRLIGGGVLVMGNKAIDFSLKAQLETLKTKLLSLKV